MSKTLVFCTAVNCGKIASVMLESFHKHHPMTEMVVVGKQSDFKELGGGLHQNTVLMDVTNDIDCNGFFKKGHNGSAYILATMIHLAKSENYDRLITIDTDIYFKKESLSLIENAFDDGYDIIGARRCYGNNPSNVPNLGNYPDTVCTYFMGINLKKLPNYPFAQLWKYCEGAAHPLGFPVLDFFDGVTHGIIDNGGKICYLDQELVGSQNTEGKKTSSNELNLHLDAGSHLLHLGGIGSGYAFYNNHSNPQQEYAQWSLGRYSLFAKLFYNEDLNYNEPTVYGEDGRWVNGNYDEKIFNLIKEQL